MFRSDSIAVLLTVNGIKDTFRHDSSAEVQNQLLRNVLIGDKEKSLQLTQHRQNPIVLKYSCHLHVASVAKTLLLDSADGTQPFTLRYLRWRCCA